MSAEVTHEIEIDAKIETVFDLLATERGLLEWIAIDAAVEPHTGGLMQWTHENGKTVMGEILEIDRPNRLVFTYGWADDPDVEAGSTVVEIVLHQDGERGVTLLRLVHRGLPDDQHAPHLDGWKYFLNELAVKALNF